MSHGLILGMTESGKSTLAKGLARNLKAKGYGVLVLDPLNDPEWQADFKTTDNEEFLKMFWDSRNCFAFIDEAGESVGKYNETMRQTATRGRHWGHSCFYISQRGTMIDSTVRAQCGHLYLFNSSADDCKTHANEWNRPELKSASGLARGEYYNVPRFGDIKKERVF